MGAVTKKGREFLYRLEERYGAPAYERHQELLVISSRVLKLSATYGRLAEEECNGPPEVEWMKGEQIDRWQKRLTERQAQLERLIDGYARDLPGVVAVKFGGDPRGATVKLVMSDEHADDWGREGICVPGA